MLKNETLKRTICGAAIFLATSAYAAPKTTHSENEIEDSVAIQKLLADSTLAGVKDASKKLADDAEKNHHEELAVKSLKVGDAKTLEEARANFEPVSTEIVKLAQTEKNKSVEVVYCPMKKVRWVQKPGAIANPFYGKGDMLECGVKEK